MTETTSPATDGDATDSSSAPMTPPAAAFIGGDISVSIAQLETRIDMLEEALEAGTLSPRDATQEWIGLLKECSEAQEDVDRHLRNLNTRLLDLFSTPRAFRH